MQSKICHIIRRSLFPTIYAMLLSIVIGSCTSDDFEISETNQSDEMVIHGSISLPDMPQTISRGIMGEEPNAHLKLTVFEFDLGSDAAHSFLSHIYYAEITSNTTAVANNGTVDFKVTLNKSAKPKVLHFMLADDYLPSDFGSVSTLLPNITVSGDSEAYWGCVPFTNGYNNEDDDATLRDDVMGKLTQIPMIRNFAKISVSVSPDVNNFELIGFDVLNVPSAGTVAPFDQKTKGVPSLLKNGKMESYNDISYAGIVPGTSQFFNTEVEAKNWDENSANLNSTESRYVYEHPYESTRRSYLIVYGNYTTGNITKSGFYKIDIGNLDSNKLFQTYNIIRNIHYNVIINEVHAAGMSTVTEAIDRAPFNNLSTATETSSMLNVSDNINMLAVNATNHIIVDKNKTIEVLYRYITDLVGSKEVHNEVPRTPDLKVGPVIKDYSKSTFTDDLGVNWIKIEILCNDPDDIARTQSFSIVDGTGLGRTINLVLRNPWKYDLLKYADGTESEWYATIKPITENEFGNDPTPENISSKPGKPLTVFFDLPDGLPESMFPLQFQLEPKMQGIENDKVGNLVVSTGPSLFDPNVVAISYIKTLSYLEYQYMYTQDDSNDVDINKPNINHTVRCRFLTINTVENGSEGEIMIYNPYFKPNISVIFKRMDDVGNTE